MLTRLRLADRVLLSITIALLLVTVLCQQPALAVDSQTAKLQQPHPDLAVDSTDPSDDPKPMCVAIDLYPPHDYPIFPGQLVQATIYTQAANNAQVVVVATGEGISPVVPVFDHNKADVSFYVDPDVYYGVKATSGPDETVRCTFQFPKRLPYCDSLTSDAPKDGIIPGTEVSFRLEASDADYYQVIRAADGIAVTAEDTIPGRASFKFTPDVNVDYAIKLRNVNGTATGCPFRFAEFFGCRWISIVPIVEPRIVVRAYGHGGTKDRWRLRDDYGTSNLPSGEGKSVGIDMLYTPGANYTLEWLDDAGKPYSVNCTFRFGQKHVYLPLIEFRR